MIRYEDLDHGAYNRQAELLYTWENPDTSQTRSWAIRRMEQHLDRINHPVLRGAIDKEQVEFIIGNRGIEQHRINWLGDPKNWKELHKPAILMRTFDAAGDPQDLTLDGHHRYVTLAALRCPWFSFHHLTEQEAEEFEVSGMPSVDMDKLVNSFSGVGERP